MKLENIKVLDLSQFLPGPHLAMTMADHGAEVIKIEPPEVGDPGRHIGLRQGEHAVFFRNMNRGKRSVCLNLKDPEARSSVLRLADRADVLIESYRPGVAERLGIGPATLTERNPRLVYCSISAFGQSGPYRHLPAHDLAIEAVSGTLSVNVDGEDQPVMPGVPTADLAASLTALTGILMALLRREQTGLGDRIDISMQDSLVAWLPNALGTVLAEERAPVPKRERTWGGAAFYNIYATSDGRHVVLGAQEIKFVRNLLTALDRLDLVEVAERGPGAHQRPLIEYLRQLFRQKSQAEWVDWFRGKDVGFAPVRDLREALDDPQLLSRDMVLRDRQGFRHLGLPIKFAQEPGRPRLQVPGCGEHTREVLSELAAADRLHPQY